MPTVAEIINVIEMIAPPELAEGWDNCGLQLGNTSNNVNRVVVALDALPEVVDEAVSIGAQLILTHHPLFFSPIKSIDLSGQTGRVVSTAIRNGISIYSAHTSYDRANPGVSDSLAAAAGLADIRPLIPFKGSDRLGLGRVGNLSSNTRISVIIERLKSATGLLTTRLVGDPDAVVSRVAVCGGSGASVMREAVDAKAGLLITGDLKYHEALDAEGLGISIVDMGHFASEFLSVTALAGILEGRLKNDGIAVDVRISRVQAEPWIYM